MRVWLAKRQIRYVTRHRDEVPAEFQGRISLRSHQRAADYTTEKTRFGMAEIIFDAIVLAAMTLGGVLQAYSDWCFELIGHPLWSQIAFLGLVTLTIGILNLPFAIYKIFVIQQKYGFNRMTPGLFASDVAKSTFIACLLGLPLVALILWLMNLAASSWWFWAWLVWAGFNLLVMYLFPTWIAPLFNRFTPLQDEELKQRIESLAKRCGFSIEGLFVMDGSRRSAHGNAYFTGFGRSRRIVFFDTLLSKLNHDEIEAVLAHELGHFKHRHIARRLVTSLLAALLMFGIMGWLSGQAWFFTSLGVQPPQETGNNALTLTLFFMVMPVFTFWLTPVMNALSRKDEFEADRFAMNNSNAQFLINALVKLYDDNAATLTPDPLHSAFYDTHPPAHQRIQHLAAQA